MMDVVGAIFLIVVVFLLVFLGIAGRVPCFRVRAAPGIFERGVSQYEPGYEPVEET